MSEVVRKSEPRMAMPAVSSMGAVGNVGAGPNPDVVQKSEPRDVPANGGSAMGAVPTPVGSDKPVVRKSQ